MELNIERDWYYYSDTSSDSSVEKDQNEWINKVNLDGSLFFVKNYPRRSDIREDSRRSESSQNNNQCDKSPGILGRFMRRRSSRRSFRKKDNRTCKREGNPSQECKSSKEKDGETEEDDGQTFVRINVIDNVATINVSLETLFGLKTIFNNTNILIIGFLPSRASFYDTRVNLGDRLYSINGIIVSARNVNEVLLGLGNNKEVLLGFKCVNNESQETELSPHFSRITGSRILQDKQQEFFTNNGGIIYAKYEGLTEGGPADQGIVYSYPKKGNILIQIRGAFFTLSHLLSTISSSAPRSTTIRWNNCVLNVLYIHEMGELLLLTLPNSRYYLEETTQVISGVGRCLEFMFQSLSRCFSNKRNGEFLDSFFHKLLTRNKADEVKRGVTNWEFESLLPVPCSFFLPKDVYMQIDDALNELESNYIPNHGNQRLFTIIGSCYFYKGYLVCNHLPNKDLLDVTALMRQNDLLQLCKDGIKDLVYWREVYPLSCQRGINPQSSVAYSIPVGRWFLLIVGMDHCFLATLLEAGGCTSRSQVHSGPDIAYVEEALATLRHIMKIELPSSINEQLNVHSCCTEDLREQTKSASTDSSSSLSSFADLQIQNKQYLSDVHKSSQAFLPIKGRSIENIKFLGNFGDGYDIPEDEIVPVLGRRAERELALETNSQSRISVSDISDDSDLLKDSKSINRNYALDDYQKSSLPEECIGAPRVSAEDENVLIHFINFEASEGILISSVAKSDNSNKYNHLLQTFRQQAHKIQEIFLNTILFKKLKTQEMPDTINKSLVAINEYGTLFQYADEAKKGDPEPYWVVGRLFFMPHPREVYVCYFDACPQSMIEIAFQLALSSVR